MSLYTRYKFKQRPDPAVVQGLINADLAGHPAPDGLPGEVHDLRQQMADTRLILSSARGADLEDYSVALLRTLARIDRQLDECEEAIDALTLSNLGHLCSAFQHDPAKPPPWPFYRVLRSGLTGEQVHHLAAAVEGGEDIETALARLVPYEPPPSLATFRQVRELVKRGMDSETARAMTFEQASTALAGGCAP
jgi:hypothetical protein